MSKTDLIKRIMAEIAVCRELDDYNGVSFLTEILPELIDLNHYAKCEQRLIDENQRLREHLNVCRDCLNVHPDDLITLAEECSFYASTTW